MPKQDQVTQEQEGTPVSDLPATPAPGQPAAAEEAPAPPSDHLRRWFGPLSLQADGQLPAWIPIHRLCDRVHPIHGAIVMTEAKMDQAIANFDAGVLRPESPRHLQIPIDTRHSGDAACGWIAEMRKELPYLMARPAWTEHGKQVVLDRQFLYISPVYEDDPERGPIFKEATLTNRDFLKMPPILLDEGVTAGDLDSPWVAAAAPDPQPPPTRRPIMSEATITEKAAPPVAETPAAPTPVPGAPASGAPAPGAAAPGAPEAKALEELQHTLKSLAELVEKQNRQLERQAAQLQAAEGDARLAEVTRLTEAAAARGVDAFTVHTLRSILLALPRKAPDVAISLEAGGQAQAFPNLYAALSHYLEHVPAQVPVGAAVTKSDQSDPQLEEEVDVAYARRLILQAGGQVKEA